MTEAGARGCGVVGALLLAGCLLAATGAAAQGPDTAPGPWTLTAAEIAASLKTAARLLPATNDLPQRMVLWEAMNYEHYSFQAHLPPGWYRLTFMLIPDRAAQAGESLEFQLWNPNGSPGAFRFTTDITPGEFGAGGKPVAVTRNLYVGPANGNLGMLLRGGWPGLALTGLVFEPLAAPVFVESIQADRLLYTTAQAGSATVRLLNGGPQPATVWLTVELQAGLDDPVVLHDGAVTVPATTGSTAYELPISFPSQRSYGHQLRAVLRRTDKQGEVLGDVRDWFYVSDHPVRIGQLFGWGSDNDYVPDPANIQDHVGQMRANLFPLAEMEFWAPDDYGLLVTPPGQTRWWAGQTLARLSQATMQARIQALHAQGMKALAYTDLRIDFGYRIAEIFRLHPTWANWDANDTDMAWAPSQITQQLRENDAERFSPQAPNKPLFGAQGVWGLQTGNPAVVDYHVNQLIASVKLFDWDGFRYDDYYDYDFPSVDLLGRKMPFQGFTVPVLVARQRAALEAVKPGIIYGHNMEWTQKAPGAASLYGQDLETPMPADTPPHEGDGYTPLVRDDGLHLQERGTTYWDNGVSWKLIGDDLYCLGDNATRRGGQAYAINRAHSWANDARTFTALAFASGVHLAYNCSDWQRPYLRLAAQYCGLLYGDTLQPAPDGTLSLQATGGRAPWWQRYVRVLEPQPGRRIYLVHLINPPVQPGVDAKNQSAPPTATGLALTWRFPPGWKAERAWEITADRTAGSDMSGAPTAVPVQRPLPLHADGGATTLPPVDVVQWSIVAVECSGSPEDRLPQWRFPLPPVPAQPTQFTTEPVAPGYTPNGFPPVIMAANHGFWKLQTGRVPDATCVAGEAVVVNGPLKTEGYFHGVQGGRYRFAVRVKSPALPPPGARLHLNVWPAGRAWNVDQDLPLDTLQPGVWTDLVLDADIGSDRGNCGVQVLGGWDGLLIDRLEISEVKPWSEAQRLAEQKLRPWPPGLAPNPNGGAWCLPGLWHEFLGLEPALQVCGVPMATASWYIWRDQRGWGGPPLNKPEDLAQYRLVVLANIDLRSLTLEQREWLRGWVEAGGSLLMTGGPYAFGRGWWQESDLIAPLLPATLQPYDLRPLGADQPLLLKGAGPLAGLRLPAGAAANWLHELTPKPGATVALTAGGKPALVLGEVGKGRVALLALASLGPDIPGAWWRSNAGEEITQATCRWLLRQG
jgi:hypothetical protein